MIAWDNHQGGLLANGAPRLRRLLWRAPLEREHQFENTRLYHEFCLSWPPQEKAATSILPTGPFLRNDQGLLN